MTRTATGIGGALLLAAALTAGPAAADPPAPTNCANAPFTAAGFYGHWWTERGSAVTLQPDGGLRSQYRSAHKIGTWALLPLEAVPGHAAGPDPTRSACTLWLRWLSGAVSGQPERTYDPPDDQLYQPLSVTAETVEFAGDGGAPISWNRNR